MIRESSMGSLSMRRLHPLTTVSGYGKSISLSVMKMRLVSVGAQGEEIVLKEMSGVSTSVVGIITHLLTSMELDLCLLLDVNKT
jgi:hypothetical protein